MLRKLLTTIAASTLICGCTSIKLATKEVAALYSTVNSEGFMVPITYSYGIVNSIDSKSVSFNVNPVFVEPGRHEVEIKYGHCFAPVLIIACDLQPTTALTIEHEFVGGKKYRVTPDGIIIEI